MLKDYLIAIDLDDTTITGYDNMDIESFDKLKELSKNNKIIIATGRPNRSSINFYDYLELDTPLVNYNGALVHKPHDPSFKQIDVSLKKEYIFEFIDGCSKYLTNIFSEVGDTVYLEHDTEEIQPFLHKTGAKIVSGHLKDILKDDPAGAIFTAENGTVYNIRDFVNKHFNGKVLVRFWSVHDPLIGEFYNPEISKGMILEQIRELYNIDKDKTIAFGDGHNDIDMLQFARYGVAMGNSDPQLLKVAKYTTDTVYEHGVKNFLEKLERGEIE